MRRHTSFAVGLSALFAAGACRGKHEEVPQVKIEAAEIDAGAAAMAPSVPGEPGKPTPAAPAGPIKEKEPNDVREQATSLPLNGGITGQLVVEVRPDDPKGKPVKGRTVDEDWYVLVIDSPSAQEVRIQLSADDSSDLALHWMPPDAPVSRRQEALAVIDNARAGKPEVLPPTILAPGRHYFRVVAAPKRKGQPVTVEGEYRLTTTVVDPEEVLEREPNNTNKEAGVLRPGETREGYIGWMNDSDWYRLELEGVPATAVVRIDLSAVQGVKSRLWLVDRMKKSLVQVPESKVTWPAGRGVTLRDIGIDPAALPYFVEVRGMKSSNPYDRYTLKVTTETPEMAHEREPNWRPQSAGPLIPDQPVDGFLGHPTDWDVYRIDAQEPKVATVVVSGVQGVDVQLEHLDATGKGIASVNELGPGSPETFPLIQVGPDPAYIRVSAKDRTFNVEQGYRIAVTLSDAGDREIEPNDDFAGADRSKLPLAKPFKGNIHPRGDSDYFALDVMTSSPDETRILTLQLSGVDGLRLGLDLFDSTQAPITRKGGIAAGETKTITHGFAPGRYYVRVRDESGQSANGNAPYILEVTE